MTPIIAYAILATILAVGLFLVDVYLCRQLTDMGRLCDEQKELIDAYRELRTEITDPEPLDCRHGYHVYELGSLGCIRCGEPIYDENDGMSELIDAAAIACKPMTLSEFRDAVDAFCDEHDGHPPVWAKVHPDDLLSLRSMDPNSKPLHEHRHTRAYSILGVPTHSDDLMSLGTFAAGIHPAGSNQ
jgi:hypothetical protein